MLGLNPSLVTARIPNGVKLCDKAKQCLYPCCCSSIIDKSGSSPDMHDPWTNRKVRQACFYKGFRFPYGQYNKQDSLSVVAANRYLKQIKINIVLAAILLFIKGLKGYSQIRNLYQVQITSARYIEIHAKLRRWSRVMSWVASPPCSLRPGWDFVSRYGATTNCHHHSLITIATGRCFHYMKQQHHSPHNSS